MSVQAGHCAPRLEQWANADTVLTLMEPTVQETDINQIISANKYKISTGVQGSKKRHRVLGRIAARMQALALVRELRKVFCRCGIQARPEG